MSKLKAILLTEGMHGMISQVEGLAKALDLDFTHHKVELDNFWKLLPPKLTPISQKVFKKINNDDFDVIISCGRKSVIPSIYLKKNSPKKVVNIHIQDPKVSLNNFDYIIAPQHDGLMGNNVYQTNGAIHYLTQDEIDSHSDYLKSRLDLDKDYFLLVLGGPTKHYDYSEKNISNILNIFNNLVIKNNLQGIVIPSMRTPKNIIELSKFKLQQNSLVIDTIDKKAYLSALSLAKYICVTCDSTSMISEAALTGKPIYVADIPTNKNDQRIRKFRELFSKLNIIKKLDNSLESWDYERLDETSRVANEIKKQLS
ncbi:mitochondrial fission ELM1 family protein [Candidatus Pelagibacter communis]|uniref:mitochondrial fission ELM1 family protein n=1 Tax=Candidatus Pelagibacter TaxID=198251 RepID=UPI003EE1A20A